MLTKTEPNKPREASATYESFLRFMDRIIRKTSPFTKHTSPSSTTVKSPRQAGLRSIKVGFIRAWFAPLTPTRARSYRDACLSELWREKQASHFMGNALYLSPSIVFSHEMIIIIVKGVGSVCPSNNNHFLCVGFFTGWLSDRCLRGCTAMSDEICL